MSTLTSKAFRRGLRQGMSSPYVAIFAPRKGYSAKSKDLVAHSWRGVGEALSSSIASEKEKFAKTSHDKLKAS